MINELNAIIDNLQECIDIRIERRNEHRSALKVLRMELAENEDKLKAARQSDDQVSKDAQEIYLNARALIQARIELARAKRDGEWAAIAELVNAQELIQIQIDSLDAKEGGES